MRVILIFWFGLITNSGFAVEPIDVNAASAAQLASVLIGIGPSKAQKIIAFRENYGPIQTPEELLAIKGIGRKTLEKNRPRIITTLIDPTTAPKPNQVLDDTAANH